MRCLHKNSAVSTDHQSVFCFIPALSSPTSSRAKMHPMMKGTRIHCVQVSVCED